MDARTLKLSRRVGDKDLARSLVKAGLDTPRKLKAAKDSEILALEGVGPAKLSMVRKRLSGSK